MAASVRGGSTKHDCQATTHEPAEPIEVSHVCPPFLCVRFICIKGKPALVTLQPQLRKFGLEARHGCSSESVGIPRAIPSPCLLVPHHAVALSESGPGRGLRSVSLTRRVKSQ